MIDQENKPKEMLRRLIKDVENNYGSSEDLLNHHSASVKYVSLALHNFQRLDTIGEKKQLLKYITRRANDEGVNFSDVLGKLMLLLDTEAPTISSSIATAIPAIIDYRMVKNLELPNDFNYNALISTFENVSERHPGKKIFQKSKVRLINLIKPKV